MSNLYNPYLHSCFGFGAGHATNVSVVDWLGTSGNPSTSSIKGFFLDTDAYTIATSLDDAYVDDIADSNKVKTMTTGVVKTFSLAGQTIAEGGASTAGITLDANDLTGVTQILAVGDTGDGLEIHAIVLYDDQGASDGADPLICAIDTGTGFGLTPLDSTVEISWSASGIFTVGV